MDHVIPKSRGGGGGWENLVSSCMKCNNKKGNRTPKEAGMPLMKTPRKETNISLLIMSMGDVEAWKRWNI
jgi:5-methylcytosine-specific restriction endonuclease McrA